MNKKVKKGVFLVLGVVLCLTLVSPVSGQEMTAKQLLVDINQKWSNVQDFHAEMTIREERDGVITEMNGTIYQKGKLQRIEVSELPERETGEALKTLLVFDGKIMWCHTLTMNMVVKINYTSLERVKGIKNNPFLYSLEVSYQVSEKNRDGKEYYCLESSDISQFKNLLGGIGMNILQELPLQKVMLWVNKASLVTERGEFYTDGEKPVVSMEFKNVKTNQNLSPKLFVFNVPEGAQVMDMTQGIEEMMESMKTWESSGGLAEAREEAKKSVCKNNLKQIGLALVEYALDHDETLPEDMGLLYPSYLNDRRVFVCPGVIPPQSKGLPPQDPFEVHGVGYIYVPGMTTEQYCSGCILAYDKEGNHDGGRNVLFIDGTVKWVTDEEWPSVLETHIQNVRFSMKRENPK